ncbi:hypothetical protein PHYPO_G00074620 [Pangasianodon hypophthalmus]|uniref:Peptidase S1 domain-containing protein n=1 Tax=Pangasianodon hypophthalmus TaxID=310915 RepID=A0A5N5LWV3_PANHP|nr:chymotrypsin-like elastase family member 3B [Pangasianodon hypophthalmus]KAB5546663.1 hypothetical protein PHYPO_G00074620 [Pangasianodon hypophthalmus]
MPRVHTDTQIYIMLKRLVFFLLLAAYAYGCGTPEIEPLPGRVVNGEEARPHSWPWQISLQYKHGSRWYHTCGGTLIAPRWVLTAGHCIFPGDIYRIVLGKHDLSVQEDTEQIRDVLRIVVHPKWNIECVACGNDIALLKLDKAPVLSASIQMACIPPAGEILPHDTPCYVSGWGDLYTHGPIPDKLQQAMLPVVEYSVCSQSDWWGKNVKPTMVCAGGDIRSSCNGDSGGPLNCKGNDGKWYVQGVTSFVSSTNCNELKKPTVFTRTSAFNDWLDEVMLKY